MASQDTSSGVHLASVIQAKISADMVARPASLTLRQVQVLQCVESWIDAHGWPPSLSELCVMLETPNKNAIRDHLNRLATKGYIRRDAGERRGLCVLIPAADATLVEPRPLKKTVVHCDRCKREICALAKKAVW